MSFHLSQRLLRPVTGKLASVLLSLSLLNGCGEPAQTEFADQVIMGGDIYTSDSERPHASAVAIKDGKFVYVGEDGGAEHWVGPHTQITQLHHNTVLPGLIDGHTHAGILSLFNSIELVSAPDPSVDKLLPWLKHYAEANPDIPVLIIDYFLTGDFGLQGPNKAMLDAVVSDRPVALLDDSGHSMWLNSKALEMMGVDKNTPDPAPGLAYYQRDANGEPTGWIKEFTMAAIQERLLNQAEPAQFKQHLAEFLQYLASQGVTHLYDGGNLGLHDRVYSTLAELDKEGRLPLYYEGTFHVHLPNQLDDAIPTLERLREQYGSQHLRFTTVKIHFDGVHEIRTSAITEPFEGQPHNLGGTLISQQKLEQFIQQLHAHKLDLHMHCVGDRATKIALDAYQNTMQPDWEYPRMTLAHLELVREEDIPRFKQLGVVANFTPHWMGDLVQGGEETLGERNHHKMRTGSFFDAEATVSFSSDVVVPSEWHRAAPLFGMQVGMLRQEPADGKNAHIMPPANERVSLEQMLQGYTMGGAYQLREDDQIGSISPGKNADLVILNGNLFNRDPYLIYTLTVRQTLLDGKTVYQQ